MVYTAPGTALARQAYDRIHKLLGKCQAPYANHTVAIDKGGVKWLMKSNHHRRLCRFNCTQLGTDSLPSGYLQVNDVYFDIRITGAPVDTLLKLILHITVTNTNSGTSPTDVIPLLPFFFFNRVEIQANGSFTDDTIYPLQWYYDYINTRNTEQKTNQATAIGMDTIGFQSTSSARTTWTTYDEADIAIVAGTQKQYFIPFDINFFCQAGTFLSCKSVDPRFRFYGALNPICSDNAAADLAGTPLLLNGAEMIVEGILFQSVVREKLVKWYSGGWTLSRVTIHERQILDAKSVSQNSETSDQSLTAFNGEYAGMWITFIRGDATLEQLYGSNRTWTAATQGFLPLTYISLKDSSGNPVNYLKMPSDLFRYEFPCCQFEDNAVYAFKEIYFYPFAKKCSIALKDGISTGGLMLDANFQLQLFTGTWSAGTTTSYSIYMNAIRYAILNLTLDGTFSINKL